jgi:bacillithiol biosynthesis deacetylase BshB1
MTRIDVLALAAHPDDVEIFAAGSLLQARKAGLTTGIVDLTRGEASNFGSAEERDEEARQAARILCIEYRHNLGIPDQRVEDTPAHVEALVRMIRELQPSVLLLPYRGDHHPDHAATGVLGSKAAFFAKLERFRVPGRAHQVSLVMYYMLHTEFSPSFVLDISEERATKARAMLAHCSQFYQQDGSTGRYSTELRNRDFVEYIEARDRSYGYRIGATYGEPYLIEGVLGLRSFRDIMAGSFRSLAAWSQHGNER